MNIAWYHLHVESSLNRKLISQIQRLEKWLAEAGYGMGGKGEVDKSHKLSVIG